jgi:hypothetical protein
MFIDSSSNYELQVESYETSLEMFPFVNKVYMNYCQMFQICYYKLLASYYDSMPIFRIFGSHWTIIIYFI